MSVQDLGVTTAPEQAVQSSAAAFAAARGQGRGALVGYLPVGYPSVPGSLAALKALCGEGGDGPGVDLVEIGLPYSDPMMDGNSMSTPSSASWASLAVERMLPVRAIRRSSGPVRVWACWRHSSLK